MKENNALHINSYFLTNKIHYNFYKVLLKYRGDKFFIPVYKKFRENHIDEVEIDYIFNGVDKKLFFTKFLKVFYLINKKNLKVGYEYIHAHTLISDGIAAYILSRMLHKKYVVTVRSTDVDFFIGNSVLFRFIAKEILSKASMVFFVSPPHKKQLNALFPNIIENKSFLLPNGIDDFWFNNIHERKEQDKKFETLNILFVGEVIKRKKLDLLIDFVQKFDDRRYNLTVVGKNSLNLDFEQISKSVENNNSIKYLGEIKDKNKLLEIYRSHDVFVLLSYSETFGVVYIEALSQGLPIIYTRGDGVDGYFEDGEVGYSCDHRSLDELKEKIDLTIDNYDSICANTTKQTQDFRWESLVKQYFKNVASALEV